MPLTVFQMLDAAEPSEALPFTWASTVLLVSRLMAAWVFSARPWASPVTALPVIVASALFETSAVPSHSHTVPVESVTDAESTYAPAVLSYRPVSLYV